MNIILKLRSRGEFVTLLQHRLKELGSKLSIDGYYGNETKSVVLQFQKDNKLKADGIVGPKTWDLIEQKSNAKKNPVPLINSENPALIGALKIRSEGPLVTKMQELLAQLGYRIHVDGKFGIGTERIVKQFQKDNKLKEDGVVGVITWQTIEAVAKAPIKKTATPKNGNIDRIFFFSQIKKEKLFNSIKQSQIDGMNFMLDGWEKSNLTDMRWLAYMLATAYHETARTMMPIAEYGKGKGRPYGKKIKMSRNGYTTPNQLYYGRGYVQLTWFENYDRMGRVLGVDLLNNPEKAMDPDIAFKIMLEGMTLGITNRGDFTGRCLEQYFNQTQEDWRNARRIINGLDKADAIAGYGQRFHRSLRFK